MHDNVIKEEWRHIIHKGGITLLAEADVDEDILLGGGLGGQLLATLQAHPYLCN